MRNLIARTLDARTLDARTLVTHTLATLPLLALAPAIAGTELVKNGSFEVNGGTGQIPPSTPAITTLADWIKTDLKNDVAQGFAFVADSAADSTGFASKFTPSSLRNVKLWGPGSGVTNGFTGSGLGQYFLAAGGDFGRASIEQQISGLTPGTNYLLTFKYAGSQATDQRGATDQKWQINFGADAEFTPVMNVSDQGFVGWLDYSKEFTAASTSQLLTFTPLGQAASSGGASLDPFLLLDGVSLQAVQGPGPGPTVPGPLPALGAAAALGWSRRLRQRLRHRGNA
jgi:hypothetical protein